VFLKGKYQGQQTFLGSFETEFDVLCVVVARTLMLMPLLACWKILLHVMLKNCYFLFTLYIVLSTTVYTTQRLMGKILGNTLQYVCTNKH